jgi:CRISPR-associated protein (TIGR02710 family)
MTRVLIVSVGGSPEPILKAVELHQPDELIFTCSAPPCPTPSLDQVIGEGTPCRHSIDGEDVLRPNLVTQLGLKGFRPDLQIIELTDPDDLEGCLSRLRSFLQTLPERFSQLELCGDFTGGTKSMSTALAFALLERQATLSVVSGPRENLWRIDRSEGLRIVNPIPFLAHRLLAERLPPLLEAHLYGRARSLLIDFARDQADRLSVLQHQALIKLTNQLQVLVLWDRFRWSEALDLGQQVQFAESWPELWSWWLRVKASLKWDPQVPTAVAITGYELVQDLLLNAERRGHRGWYDDAVARLYRATELLAQTYIQLELGLAEPPDWSVRELQLTSGEWFTNTGVRGLYRWLEEHEAQRGRGKGTQGLGCIYARQGRELKKLFISRNKSLLGHGLRPIGPDTWQSLQNRVSDLLEAMLHELGIKQGAWPCQLPRLELLRQPFLSVLLDPSTLPQP